MTCRVLHGEPMSRHTSWRVGGNADHFYLPRNNTEFINALQRIPSAQPVYCIGLGSNLLVRDGGVRGSVLSMTAMPQEIERRGDVRVQASAGTPCAKLARRTAQWGLSGAEFMAGIPGTLGGALAMNAGAWGSQTWDVVIAAETTDRNGDISSASTDHFSPAYRHVQLDTDTWFLGALFELQQDDTGRAQARIRELLKERALSQPLGKFSCGSVFKNPDNDHAARLIDECGLKGHSIGGATVSEKHANFIINTGSATATDIESLIGHIREVVADMTGITLEQEVRIIGEATRH